MFVLITATVAPCVPGPSVILLKSTRDCVFPQEAASAALHCTNGGPPLDVRRAAVAVATDITNRALADATASGEMHYKQVPCSMRPHQGPTFCSAATLLAI